MAAIFTFDPSSIEGLAKVGVHVCYSAALKGSMSERRSDASDDVAAEFAFQSCFTSARRRHPNINPQRCLPLGPLERRRAVAGKGGTFAEDCLSCRLVQCVHSNSTASSTGAELVEQHRDTTPVAVNQGRPSFGYFAWPRKKSDQLPVCHRRTWIPAYAGMTGSMPRVCHPVNETSPRSATGRKNAPAGCSYPF